MSSKWNAVYEELGLRALAQSPRDTKVLCLQRFVRLFAYGSSTLVLPLFLTGLGNSAERLGLFMTMTLLGDVVVSLFLTMFADQIGRRRMLAFGSLLMTASGVVFALSSQYWILVLASIFGVISPRYVPASDHVCAVLLTVVVEMKLDPSKQWKSRQYLNWSSRSTEASY